MPALNMKAKLTTTCKRDESFPHVSQKSNKISKLPCSIVRVTHEPADLNKPTQMPDNGFKNEVTSMESDNGKFQMSFNGDKTGVQTCLSSDEDSESIEKRDSSPIYLSSSLETMCSPFSGSDDVHCNVFDAVDRVQIAPVPQVDDNSPNYQTSHMLDSYIYEMCLTGFPMDRISVFDDNVNYNTLSLGEFDGTNWTYDVTEGFMLCPSYEETVEGTDSLYEGSCEDFLQGSDYSWFQHMCHQTKPFTQEHDVGHCPFDSDEVDYSDPESFIRNFPELSDESSSLPALVSKETSKRKHVTLVLDLDETLVHSTMEPCDGADFTIQVFFDKKEHTVYVRQRPFLQAFLDKVSEMFEIIIFTASQSIYAEKLLDVLDPDRKLFSRRVYRESCIFSDGSYAKDLTVLGVDLAKVVIVDNSPQVFRLQADNGIPIESWFDDPSDSALISLLPFLETLVDVDDVRPIISKKFIVKD